MTYVLSIQKLIELFDTHQNDPLETEDIHHGANVSAINGMIGEEVLLGVYNHYVLQGGNDVCELNHYSLGVRRNPQSKRNQLDGYARIKSSETRQDYFEQIEIKNWTGHSLGGYKLGVFEAHSKVIELSIDNFRRHICDQNNFMEKLVKVVYPAIKAPTSKGAERTNEVPVHGRLLLWMPVALPYELSDDSLRHVIETEFSLRQVRDIMLQKNAEKRAALMIKIEEAKTEMSRWTGEEAAFTGKTNSVNASDKLSSAGRLQKKIKKSQVDIARYQSALEKVDRNDQEVKVWFTSLFAETWCDETLKVRLFSASNYLRYLLSCGEPTQCIELRMPRYHRRQCLLSNVLSQASAQ